MKLRGKDVAIMQQDNNVTETLVSPVCLYLYLYYSYVKVKRNEAGLYSHLNDCTIY